jgi:hypothetical protein
MTMPFNEFIELAAKDAFHAYMGGGDSRLDLSYPALIYDVSESIIQNEVKLKRKVLLENHYQRVNDMESCTDSALV